ncbi:MAG: M14 family zinc carboxypeptidase [Bacteroidota bacterium]|nr:M14 family zinc carboxypeptidase [Bacteroidota bacterium]
MTKKFTLIIFLLTIVLAGSSIAQDLSYYLPKGVVYNPEIPKPEDVLGFRVGEFHASHDNIVDYFRHLAQASPRVKYEVYGKTHENRPITVAIISSESNMKRIEEIRQQHLQLNDPSVSSKLNVTDLPVVVWLSHSIHGNEASATNCSMLTAYYLASASGKEMEEMLEKTVILIDPATNPDGVQRFSTWANGNKSYMTNPDPASREHNESWPGGRYNHYWFDLNRDWLPIEQPESEARIRKLQEWKPNILIDEHEQGANSSFHFSPGEPSRINSLISAENQALTQKLADNYAKAFDEAGSFYFSKERYDDYYIGRGSTYPDLNGGVALLFEQASVRGFVQESENGLLTFPFAIRNQFIGTISTVKTAFSLKNEFLNYQRNYYLSAIEVAKKEIQKAYVFGALNDRNTTFKFAQLLNNHGIKSYLLKNDLNAGTHSFKASFAYVVPVDQAQYRLIKSIFGLHLNPKDSSFYDISAWNIPQAYNLPFEMIKTYSGITGDIFSEEQLPKGKIIGSGLTIAYVFKWDDYHAPGALSRLLNENIVVKVAGKSFETLDGLKFGQGSILIPLGSINTDQAKVEKIISEINLIDGIDVYLINTGDNKSVDLGSSYFSVITKPKIAVLTDDGVNAINAGQIWHLLDTKYKIPFTMLPLKAFKQSSLNRYNIIVMPDGNYQDLDEKVTGKLQDWVAAGNTLIAFESAINWLNKNKLVTIELEKDEIKAIGFNYENSALFKASREIPGTVFETRLDLTHPINYGFQTDRLPAFKDNKIIQLKAENISANYPVWYTSSPLLDGYAPLRFIKSLSGTPALGIFGLKKGRIIAYYNNVVFRGYWSGTSRQFANGLFFGDKIRLSSGNGPE